MTSYEEGIQVWQDVPNAIKNYPKHTFKKAYTKFLLQSYKLKKKNKKKGIQACLDSVILDYCFVKIKIKKSNC